LLHGNGGDTFWDTEVSWWQEEGFVPLYTYPVKELTDEEIQEVAHDFGEIAWLGDTTYEFARAILRKAQEK
jgi:hypothetical protein